MSHATTAPCRTAVGRAPRLRRRWLALPLALAVWGCGSITSDWGDAEKERTAAAYQDFIKRHPGTFQARTARTRLLELRWAPLRASTDLAALTALQEDVDKEARSQEPQRRMPAPGAAGSAAADGREASYPPALRSLAEQISARRAELTWEGLRGSEDAARIEAFLKAFPKAGARRDAEARLDDLSWQSAAREGTPAAWRGYLKRFGSGRHAEQARGVAENPSWDEVRASGDEAALKEHLALFARGATAAPAREALAEVVWRRAERVRDDLRPYREYLELLPNGPRAQAAQDAVDWAAAEDDGTIGAVEQYLRRHPEGLFAAHARAALPGLRSGAPPKVEATVRSVMARLEQQVQSSLRQMSARSSVAITGSANVSDAAMVVVWQGGGMTSYSQSLPGKDAKVQEAYRMLCTFSGTVGPGGLTSLAISDRSRASLRLDGASYARTTQGWLPQIKKHFKTPPAPEKAAGATAAGASAP
jgi:hypothetical protein